MSIKPPVGPMKITGDNILHALDYLKRKKGTNGVDAVIRQLDFDIMSTREEGMYPLEHYHQLLEKIDEVVSQKKYSVAERIGYDRAKKIGFLKYKGQTMEPLDVFEKIRSHWSRFNDFGRFNIKQAEDNKAHVILSDYEGDPLYCQRMNGFIKGILVEVCGKRDARVIETSCVCNGDKDCTFEASW